MKGNGAEKGELFSVQVRLTADEIADAKALCTILAITMSELGTRAIRAELKATEAAPTVHAAIMALRGARESIRRKQAVREGKE